MKKTKKLAPPLASFPSFGRRRFTVGRGVHEESYKGDPFWHDVWPILYKGKQAGKLWRNASYKDAPWSATTREIYWQYAADAPTGIGFDVSAFKTAKEALTAWSRSADQILDWSEGKTVVTHYGRPARKAKRDMRHWKSPATRKRGARRTARDHRFQLPGGMEFTPEEERRMRRAYRRAGKLRALAMSGQRGSGHFQAPRGVRDTSTRRYRVIWVRDDKGTRGVLAPGPFTHKEAVTVLSKITKRPWRREMVEEIRSRRDAGVVPRGATQPRDLRTFTAEVKALLFSKGFGQYAIDEILLPNCNVLSAAWAQRKAPCAVADFFAGKLGGRGRRDPRRKRPRKPYSKRRARTRG